MNTRRTVCGIILSLTAVGCNPPSGGQGMAPEKVADYIHAVIAADRETYAEDVVHRLQNVEKVIRANEKFKEEKGLPLPAQMLRMGAQRASEKGDFRYALISLFAINKANMPRTDFERRGLEQIAGAPDRPFTSYESAGGKRYFMAVYADRAVSDACVDCHNAHKESPRHDFKRGDVMGGLVIALPVS